MLESEAKEKWCPFARYSSGGAGNPAGGSFNRSNQNDAPLTFCIASKCMAWRWVHEDTIGKTKDGVCGLAR